jgi:hypothetical protein
MRAAIMVAAEKRRLAQQEQRDAAVAAAMPPMPPLLPPQAAHADTAREAFRLRCRHADISPLRFYSPAAAPYGHAGYAISMLMASHTPHYVAATRRRALLLARCALLRCAAAAMNIEDVSFCRRYAMPPPRHASFAATPLPLRH